jgi:hypothetical protein
MDYHTVPAETLDDTEELITWAEEGPRGCPSCCGLKG